LPALLGVGRTRPAQRSKHGVGRAGLGRRRERQAEVDDAEPADETPGAGREQRTLQATEGERDVGAEGGSAGIVAEAAREVDGHAQALEGFGRPQETGEVGGQLPAEALPEDAVEDQAEPAPRQPGQGRRARHAHRLPEALPDRRGLPGLGGAVREDDGHRRARVREDARREERVRAVVALAREHQHPPGRPAEQPRRAHREVRRGADHQVPRPAGVAADPRGLGRGGLGAGQHRQGGGGLHLSARGRRRPGRGHRYG
jgi:hypothetical protein